MKVSIEKQKDGTFIAYNIDGDSTIIGTGNSVSEAREDFLFSMEETKDMCKRHGLKEPEILEQVPEFKFDLSSLFEYYQIFNVSKLAEFVGDKQIAYATVQNRQYVCIGKAIEKD